MLRLTIIILLFIFPFLAIGQTENAATVDQYFPPPPNAASLGKYGEVPVNEFNGTSNVSIPIHSLQEGDLSLPISLNYHTGGIKVAEVSSWVGLGWALSAGGTITRRVNGTIDEGGYSVNNGESSGWYEFGNHYADLRDSLRNLGWQNGENSNCQTILTTTQLQQLNIWEHGLTTGLYDSEPDIFYLNLPGYNGKFYFNANQEVILDPYDNVKVEVDYQTTLPNDDYSKFSYFKITLPNGTVYWLGGTQTDGQITSALDRSYSIAVGGDPSTSDEMVNSWHLVRMESINGDYVINFNYDKHTFNDFSRSGRSVFCESGGFLPVSTQASENECLSYNRTLTEEAILQSIQSDHQQVDFIRKNEDRKDFWYHPFYSPIDVFPDFGKPSMLEKIEVHTNGQCAKRFELNTNYFPTYGLQEATFLSCYGLSGVTFDRERPRLSSVVQKSCSNEPDLTHFFNYMDLSALPSRLSYKQDLWGYYTDNSGLSLLPDLRKVHSAIMQDDPSFSLVGANGLWDQETEDRNPHQFRAQDFSLRTITYPTGAKTEIIQEVNKIEKPLVNETGSSQLHSASNSNNVCPNENAVGLNNISFAELFTSNGNYREYFDLEIKLKASTDASCAISSTEVLLGNLLVTKQDGGQEVEVYSESFAFKNEPNSEKEAHFSLGIDLPFETESRPACWWEKGEQYNIYVSKGFDEADTGFENHPLEITVNINHKTVQLYNFQEHLVGGLRIKEIKETDGDNTYVTKYDYKDEMGIESGAVVDFPKFVNKVSYSWDHECGFNAFLENPYSVSGCGGQGKIATHQFRSAPVLLLASSSGHTIGYKNVTKTRGQSGGAGHTTSEYIVDCISRNSKISPRSWLLEQAEIPIFPVESRLLGKMINQKSYAENATAPISEASYEYEEKEINTGADNSFSQYFRVFRCPTTNGTLKYLENIPNSYVRLKEKKEKLDGLETITQYNYRPDNLHIIPIETIVKRYGIALQTTSSFYPQDILDQGDTDLFPDLMQNMLDRNMVNTLVKSESYGLEAKGMKNVMIIQGNSGRILPYKSIALERDIWVTQSELFYDNNDQFPDRLRSKSYQDDITLNWNTPYSAMVGGLLQSQTILNHTTSFEYNYNRLLSRRTNLDNSELSYEYDGFWRLKKMTERGAAGGLKSEATNDYQIDFAGADNHILSTISYPDGNSLVTKEHFRPSGLALKTERLGYGPNGGDITTTSCTYDEYKRLATKDNYQTGLTTFAYYPDPLNRAQSETYVDGSSRSFAYDSDNALQSATIVTDENGNVSRTFTDLLGRTKTSARAINGNFATTAYDYFPFGGLEKVTSPEGHTYDYTYDVLGRMITKKIPGQGISSFTYDTYYRLQTSTDPNGIVQQYAYDAYNRPTLTTVDGTAVVFNQYDKQSAGVYLGKLWKTTETILDNTGYSGNLINEWELDEFGRATLEKIDNHVGGQDLIYNSYDFADNVLTTNKAHVGFETLNVNMTNSYDHSFRLTDEYIQLGFDAPVHITENIYNDKDQLALMRIRGKTGSILQNVNYQYNSRAWLTHINDVNEQGLPLVKCDDRTVECVSCFPAKNFEANKDLGSQAQFVVLDVQGGGGLSMALNYPYRQTELNVLKSDIENWLQANAFAYTAVTANWANGSLTLAVSDSEFEFNKLIIANNANVTEAVYFGIDDAVDYLAEQEGFCGLCHQYGYECASCPIWEILSACPTCPKVEFEGLESPACEACHDLGEGDCTSCAIGGYGVLPLELKLYLEPNTLIAGDDHLIAFEASSLVLLEDGFSSPIYPTGNAVLGDPFQAQAHQQPIVITVDLPALIIAKDNQPNLATELELKILSELDSTFIDLGLAGSIGTTKLPELAQIVTQELMEAMAPFAKGPIGGINPPPTSSSSPIVDLFGMVLDYQDGHAVSGAPGQYNGNISGLTWQSAGERKQTYGFQYDNLDRISRSLYYDWTVNGTWDTDQKFASNYGYDLDGNILALLRNGALAPCRSPKRVPAEGYSYGQIDNLQYTYNSQNQLTNVSDASVAYRGFKNGASNYAYDGAGNLITDSGKGLTIQYNFLNLPGQMDFATGNMQFKYTPSGAKLQKNVVGGDAPETIDYVGNIEYKDGEVAAIHHSQGRITPVNRPRRSYRYQFHLKDHLGNTRVLFEDVNQDGTISKLDKSSTGNTYIADLDEVQGIYHYYPFGMKHDGVWTDEPWDKDSKGRKYDYQYNGKELNEEFGLGWSDYGARWYDASVGRFTTIDRYAEKYNSTTPYHYALNNPLKFVDIQGDSVALIIGKPYIDNKGVEHKYGHVALRVFNSKKGYDYVYDFGRYGRTWGLMGSKGEGILNIYNNSNAYYNKQSSFRDSEEFAMHTTPSQDQVIVDYYKGLAEEGEDNGNIPGGGGKSFRLENDYNVFDNNCCTISGEGLEQVSNDAVGSDYDPRDLIGKMESNYKDLGFTKRTTRLKGGVVKVTYERKPEHSSTGSNIKDYSNHKKD